MKKAIKYIIEKHRNADSYEDEADQREQGRAIYSKRIGTVEPVFANIRHALGLYRFTLRAKTKVDIQFKKKVIWIYQQSFHGDGHLMSIKICSC